MENEESHAVKLKLHNIVPSGFDGGVHTRIVRPALHGLAPGLQRVVLSDWDAAALPPRLETLRLSSAGLERLSLAPK